MADMVRIDTFYDPEKAHIALGYLLSHGISATTLLFGAPLAWNSGRFRCVHCGTIAKGRIKT